MSGSAKKVMLYGSRGRFPDIRVSLSEGQTHPFHAWPTLSASSVALLWNDGVRSAGPTPRSALSTSAGFLTPRSPRWEGMTTLVLQSPLLGTQPRGTRLSTLFGRRPDALVGREGWLWVPRRSRQVSEVTVQEMMLAVTEQEGSSRPPCLQMAWACLPAGPKAIRVSFPPTGLRPHLSVEEEHQLSGLPARGAGCLEQMTKG